MTVEHGPTPALLEDEDLYLPSKESNYRTTVALRLIALTKSGHFPMVVIDGWLGVPGGRVKKSEAEGNLVSRGAFSTLIREFAEECGIDMSPYLSKSACLGIAEVTEVDTEKRRITERLTPIFVCEIPDSALSTLRAREDIVVVNIFSHLPGPLYLDARMAITYLKWKIDEGRGFGAPVPLNITGKCYFQTRPAKAYLFGRPW